MVTLIRPAELADLGAILAIDHNYVTDYVWQMDEHNTGGDHVVTFRLAQLPRPVRVASPYDSATLQRCLYRCDYLWVAQANQEISGYIGMALVPWQSAGVLAAFAVAPPARRRGVGSQLLETAIRQARADGLSAITLGLAAKNYPATRFCQTRGFRLSGYADRYYASGDIALFFTYRIK
jgi:ribosomal protein S18 acetylase RimI-like enzyme